MAQAKIVRSTEGERFQLTSTRFVETQYRRYVTRAALAKVFGNQGTLIQVTAYGLGGDTDRHFSTAYRDHFLARFCDDGQLYIGCKEFSVETTAIIKRWAKAGAKRKPASAKKKTTRKSPKRKAA